MGLLLTGLRFLQAGLLSLSSRRLTRALRAVAASRLRAFLAGVGTSALTQSSTAVSIITIGLTHARLIALSEAIAVILGANIGTTLTVQFIALHPGRLALLLGLSGIPLLARRSPARFLGQALTGTGMVFAGLDLLNRGLAPLKSTPWFAAGLAAAGENHLLAIAVATLFTALLHSSSAATGLVMALYAQGAISRETAVALVLGNNIGTCFTALIVSLTSSAAGRRVAAAHFLLNTIGAAVFLPLINTLSLIGGLTASDPARQVANIHTIYNIVSSLAALPFCTPFARLLERLVPDRRPTS
ncbi:Na/Pi cotransporter family protein [Thermodesulfitimonas autotrophica]|uniref:Na/Pi cotransporter family protein n=1 Tax=Thermodesulfitimonas autotrophica TaxID=1894989 RepID=UPI002482A72E|nr:Na/Pi symporter [Thermodesulfitimonas autotrophica]